MGFIIVSIIVIIILAAILEADRQKEIKEKGVKKYALKGYNFDNKLETHTCTFAIDKNQEKLFIISITPINGKQDICLSFEDIIADRDYKYAYDVQEKIVDGCKQILNTPHHLCIHFEQAYKVFSSYYRQLKRVLPPTQKELLLYAKNDKNIEAGKKQTTKGVYINGIIPLRQEP